MSTQKTDTMYVDASAPMMVKPERQSHLCCGGCCDTRRATIIVNIVNMCFAAIALLGTGAVTAYASSNQFDDDAVKNSVAAATDHAWIMYLVNGLALAFGALGIYGAKEYKEIFVAISGLWHAAIATMGIIGGDFAGAICSGLFAYPHFVLYQEMKKGIMTKENYPNEMHSCCCV